MKSRNHSEQKLKIFRNEIDVIVELEDGSWCEIEIKLGANQIGKAALVNNSVN
ncbi:MAG: hypothetical protein IJ656_03415 [Bacilli bacterium]|nr:hypothetical protein [Bacilli bacterium]MBR1582062.1 hypothetical protein [Bacilli bacterium]